MSGVSIPNPLNPLLDKALRATQIFRQYLEGLDGDTKVTLATLPSPKVGYRCFVLDATGGPVPCYADGENWRRYSNDAIVS